MGRGTVPLLAAVVLEHVAGSRLLWGEGVLTALGDVVRCGGLSGIPTAV